MDVGRVAQLVTVGDRARSSWSISLFGPLRIVTPTAELGPTDLGGIKPKALLEVLLLARGRLVSKDRLAEALWPTHPPRNVGGTLETYVSVLRGKLARDRAEGRQVLTASHGAYRFVPGGSDLDVARFDALLDEATGAPAHERLRLRRSALDLATGELLEDEPYAVWVQEERARYRDKVVSTHLLVADDATAAGDFVLALHHGEAALAVNALAEEAFQVVMTAHYGLGHAELARQAFLRCRAALERELDVDPTSETMQIASAIDAGAPVAEIVGRPDRTRWAVPSLHRRDRRDPSRQLPLLGRAAELDRILAAVRASRSGRCALVVVDGPPGIGRSALLDQLAPLLPGTTGRVGYTPRDVDSNAPPLSRALSTALTDPVATRDVDDYIASPGVWDDEVLGSLVGVISRHAPMTLLLDDVHWASEAALAAIEWLRRHASTVPLAVVATLRAPSGPRPGDAPPPSAADRLRMVADVTVTLGPLRPADGAVLEGGSELVSSTSGHPWLMAELWRWRQSGRVGRPPTVDRSVVARLRRVGPDLLDALVLAAQDPEPFPLAALAAPDATPSCGDVLALLGGLLEVAPPGDRLRFASPVVHEVIASVPPRQRDNLLGETA